MIWLSISQCCDISRVLLVSVLFLFAPFSTECNLIDQARPDFDLWSLPWRLSVYLLFMVERLEFPRRTAFHTAGIKKWHELFRYYCVGFFFCHFNSETKLMVSQLCEEKKTPNETVSTRLCMVSLSNKLKSILL